VLVSYYHHHKLIRCHNFTGDLAIFTKRFMNDQLMYSPFFEHIKEAWDLRESPNLLFVFYEEMKKDLRSVVERVAKFLDTKLDENKIKTLLHHLEFKQMKDNLSVNKESTLSL